MKHLKRFLNYITESFSEEESPINYNSGAYSVHLNFDIRQLSGNKPLIYPGQEYTTNSDSSSKELIEKFVEAIQKSDLSNVKTFYNGYKKTPFVENAWLVSCGTNNFNIREISEKIWKYKLFTINSNNYIDNRSYEEGTKPAELEDGKIYTVFTFVTDVISEDYTGIIDVTEGVKAFINKVLGSQDNS